MKKLFVLACDEAFIRNIDMVLDKKEYQVSYPTVLPNSLFTYCCSFKPDVCIIHSSYVKGFYQMFDALVSSRRCMVLYISKMMEYGALYNVSNNIRFHMMNDYYLPTVRELLVLMERNVKIVDNMQNELERIKEKQEEDRLVKRAKLLLMNNYNLTEDEAYKLILKRSMDDRVSKASIAKNIINNEVGK